jgi:cytochrome P450
MRAPPYSSRLDELFSREAIDDPYPLYARLRRECPMSRVADTGVHLVATWDLIDEALDREDDFSANLTGVLVRGPHGLPTTLELPPSPASRVIATADEPAHAVHRAVVQRRLTPPNVTALEPDIRSWAKDAVAEWLDGGAGDFIPVAEGIRRASWRGSSGCPMAT